MSPKIRRCFDRIVKMDAASPQLKMHLSKDSQLTSDALAERLSSGVEPLKAAENKSELELGVPNGSVARSILWLAGG
jgi:hypothetical protein